MNNDILVNIKNQYPDILQFGLNCRNCILQGDIDSKEFGLCGNCCVGLLNNFDFRLDKDDMEQFIKSDSIYELQKRLYYFLHNHKDMMNRFFDHIDKNK